MMTLMPPTTCNTLEHTACSSFLQDVCIQVHRCAQFVALHEPQTGKKAGRQRLGRSRARWAPWASRQQGRLPRRGQLQQRAWQPWASSPAWHGACKRPHECHPHTLLHQSIHAVLAEQVLNLLAHRLCLRRHEPWHLQQHTRGTAQRVLRSFVGCQIVLSVAATSGSPWAWWSWASSRQQP